MEKITTLILTTNERKYGLFAYIYKSSFNFYQDKTTIVTLVGEVLIPIYH